ncbi:MFS transporter [Paludibacterium sp. THUN1379]|nr:MFS transporter [Paludibacterium sp. THUN1379]
MSSVLMAIVPIMTVVLVGYLVVGLALPVLPIFINHELGFGTFVVGLVSSSQFAASLLTRVWAGNYSDTRGPKQAVMVGLIAAVVSGLIYLLSLHFLAQPILSAVILILGRGLLGGAASFIITGALGWGLARVGAAHAGKVISWVGTAMYAAFAAGAPLGTVVYQRMGFAAVAGVTILFPLAAILMVVFLHASEPQPRKPSSVAKVMKSIWLPGLGLAFSSIGFAAITTFIVLLFVDHGWGPLWLPFTAFAIAFMAPRTFLGHLTDKAGGARVALISIVIEAAGLTMVRFAPSSVIALTGVVVCGLGYSLVYPGLGVEAVRSVPAENHGMAMGGFTAFLDVALGVSSPLLGLVGGWAGVPSIFLVSALLVVCGAPIAYHLGRQSLGSEVNDWEEYVESNTIEWFDPRIEDQSNQ